MDEQFGGTKAEVAAQIERIVRAIVPDAECRIEDNQDEMTCWVEDAIGIRRTFTVAIDALDRAKVETLARDLRLEKLD